MGLEKWAPQINYEIISITFVHMVSVLKKIPFNFTGCVLCGFVVVDTVQGHVILTFKDVGLFQSCFQFRCRFFSSVTSNKNNTKSVKACYHSERNTVQPFMVVI